MMIMMMKGNLFYANSVTVLDSIRLAIEIIEEA